MRYILIVVILLAGCDLQEQFNISSKEPTKDDLDLKYKLFESREGTIRLDQVTGEVVIISSDGVSVFDNEKIKNISSKNEAVGVVITNTLNKFPESQDEMWSELKFKWRNGNILYKYSFGPFDNELHKIMNAETNNLGLKFTDKDGFIIVSDMINLNLLTRVIGPSGEPESWQSEGTVKCSKEDYMLIYDFSFPWYFKETFKKALRKKGEELAKKRDEENRQKLVTLIESGEILGEIKNGKIYRESGEVLQEITDPTIISNMVAYPDLYRIKSDQNDSETKQIKEEPETETN